MLLIITNNRIFSHCVCSIWFYVTSLNVFHVSSAIFSYSFTLYNYFIVLFEIAFILIKPQNDNKLSHV